MRLRWRNRRCAFVFSFTLFLCLYTFNQQMCKFINVSTCCFKEVSKEPYLFVSKSTGTNNSVVEDIRFTINPDLCRGRSPWLVIGVVSHVTHYEERVMVRNTWGSVVESHPEHLVILVFIVGQGENSDKTLEVKLSRESRTHKDIIQVNVKESYIDLVKKSIALLKWTNDHCTDHKYVMKVDDDVFINIPKLVSVLNPFQAEEKFIMGQIFRRSKPNRSVKSKHYMSKESFPDKFYPAYVTGAAYVISGVLVRELVKVIAVTSLIHVEDVYITGICGSRAKAVMFGDCGFSYFHVPLNQALNYPGRITYHGYTLYETKRLWKALQTASEKRFFA